MKGYFCPPWVYVALMVFSMIIALIVIKPAHAAGPKLYTVQTTNAPFSGACLTASSDGVHALWVSCADITGANAPVMQGNFKIGDIPMASTSGGLIDSGYSVNDFLLKPSKRQ